MKTTYEVRFTLYHFNSGNAQNGNYAHKSEFTNLAEANSFAEKLNRWLVTKESTSEFAGKYCWGGHLVSVNGVYEVTERKVS